MSEASVRRSFTNPLLKKLEAEMRKGIERQGGQVLILKDIKAFIEVIETTYPDIKIKKSDAKRALDAGTKKALELSKRYRSRQKRRYNAVIAKIEKILPMSEYTWDKNIFVVASFKRSISSIKLAILKELQRARVITESQRTRVQGDIHKGHGVEGTAVSQVQIANTLMAAVALDTGNKTGLEFLKDNLKSFFEISETPTNIQEEINKLTTRYNQIVTKDGKLRADYASIIDFQSSRENIKDSGLEKKIKGVFRDFIADFAEKELYRMKGSSSLEDKIETVIIDNLTDKVKNAKVTRRAKNRKLTSKGTVSVKGTKTKSTARVRSAGTLKKGSKAKTKTKSSSFSQTKLYAALNAKISVTVAKNMGEPALEYQTGRFANSVRITDISTTKLGFPSVGYTYQLYPYQTFEPGFAQGDVDRDPRKLIDRSIREIAAQMLTGRLYTRRQ
jgi:hypothetical protein